MLSTLLVLTVGVTPADVAVVVARKQGVSQGQADAVVNLVAKAFDDAALRVDLPETKAEKCGGKRACLVGIGRALKVPVLVTIEIGAVLDEADVFVEALAIEQDGRKLGREERHMALDDLSSAGSGLQKLIEATHKYVKPSVKFVPKTTVGEPPTVVDAGTPTPSVDAGVGLAPIVDAGTPVVVALTPSPAPTSARQLAWVPLIAVGVGAVMAGVGFGFAKSTETELRASGDLMQVRALASRGEAFQATGLVGVGVAAVGAITAALMFLMGAPPENASAALWPATSRQRFALEIF